MKKIIYNIIISVMLLIGVSFAATTYTSYSESPSGCIQEKTYKINDNVIQTIDLNKKAQVLTTSSGICNIKSNSEIVEVQTVEVKPEKDSFKSCSLEFGKLVCETKAYKQESKQGERYSFISMFSKVFNNLCLNCNN